MVKLYQRIIRCRLLCSVAFVFSAALTSYIIGVSAQPRKVNQELSYAAKQTGGCRVETNAAPGKLPQYHKFASQAFTI